MDEPLIKEEKYFIFEYGRSKQKLFFSPEEFVNQKLKINRLTLLHFDCIETDYYLFYGKNDHNFVEFLFQFNEGDEFAEYLINNGAIYHQYEVVEIIDSGYAPKFKLKDGQKIQYETYATGITKGLNIYQLSEENNKIVETHGSHKILLGLPIAKLYLDNTKEAITLKWSSESENDEIPATFTNSLNEELAKQKKAEKKGFYYKIILFAMAALVIYYFYFM